MILLNSSRLIYREFDKGDFHLYRSIFSNEQVMKYAWFDCVKDEKELLKGFSEVLECNEKEQFREEYNFVVCSEEDNSFIGSGLIIVSYRGEIQLCGEIGYFLLPEYWGRGYATEIAGTLTDFCFNSLKLHRVVASCNVNNGNSENIMKKLGMRKEGEFRKARFKNGNWDNELRYSVLKEEWEKVHTSSVKMFT